MALKKLSAYSRKGHSAAESKKRLIERLVSNSSRDTASTE